MNFSHSMSVLKTKRFYRSTENNLFDWAKTKCAFSFRQWKTKIESKKGSEKPTGRDKHGQTKTVGDREGRGTEKKWKQPRKGKFGGHAMGHCRKILYFAFRRISKKHKEASDFHCCRRQKYLQTKCMERARPTLFNEYFISNIFF